MAGTGAVEDAESQLFSSAVGSHFGCDGLLLVLGVHLCSPQRFYLSGEVPDSWLCPVADSGPPNATWQLVVLSDRHSLKLDYSVLT